MSASASASVPAKGSKVRTVVKKVAYVIIVACLLYTEAHWHWVEEMVADNHPDRYLSVRTKEVLSDKVSERTDQLLAQVEANPEHGVKAVRKELAAYNGWVNELEGKTPPPEQGKSNTPPRQSVTNLEDFSINLDNIDNGEIEVQLDARLPWRVVTPPLSSGDVVEFEATGLVCGGESVGCAGPNGQSWAAKNATPNPEDFPYGEAFCQSLIGRIGGKMFQVGDHKPYEVPDGIQNQPIELMANLRSLDKYAQYDSGGFRVKIKIRKKT